jgi:flavin reductase (DIM6/NTAB) family NADH-FMN oxidoreductase RutF
MPTESARRDPLSYFWAPLCAVGSHGPSIPNAQICVSVFGASIVPERPRLLVVLTKTNLTHDLVRDAGTLAVTLLSEDQVGLLEPLGLRSGRDGDKLGAIEHSLTPAGDPYFPGGVGRLDCEVLDAFDLGDSTAFLAAVRGRESLGSTAPMAWAGAQRVVGEEFMRRWAEKSEREREIARRRMTWR